MTAVTPITFAPYVPDDLADFTGKLAVFVTEDGKMDQSARKVNSLTRKTVQRVIESDGFEKAKAGDLTTISMPFGLQAEALLVLKLPRRPTSPRVDLRRTWWSGHWPAHW